MIASRIFAQVQGRAQATCCTTMCFSSSGRSGNEAQQQKFNLVVSISATVIYRLATINTTILVVNRDLGSQSFKSQVFGSICRPYRLDVPDMDTPSRCLYYSVQRLSFFLANPTPGKPPYTSAGGGKPFQLRLEITRPLSALHAEQNTWARRPPRASLKVKISENLDSWKTPPCAVSRKGLNEASLPET